MTTGKQTIGEPTATGPGGGEDGATPPSPSPPGSLVLAAGAMEMIVGVVLALAAVAIWLTAHAFDDAEGDAVGPATFPKGIAILLGVTAMLLAGQGLLARRGRSRLERVAIGRPFGVIGGAVLMIVFPALMKLIGYYAATAVFLPAFLLVAGYTRPLGILLVTAGFLIFAKVAFELALGVRLP
jgi:hypothetical protein